MTAKQSLLAFLFAACLAQGAFLAPVIANMKGVNRRATGILALLILCFLPMIGEEFIEISGWTDRFPHTIASSTALDYAIAPLLLLYAWTVTDRERRITRRDLLHFLPFCAALLILLPFYLLSGEEKLRLADAAWPISLRLVIAGKIVIGGVYLTLVIRYLLRFVNQTERSAARDPNVVWLLRAMASVAVMAGATIVMALLPAAGVETPIDSDALGTLVICGSIYLISFLLIRHPLSAAAAAGVPITQLVVPGPLRARYQ
ncbi:MAG: hypothetical protein ACREMA_16690, partial [Longimicrobiales bacterium]